MEQLGYPRTEIQETWYLRIFRKSVEKFKFTLNMARITGTLHVDLPTFIIVSRWILLRVRDISVNIWVCCGWRKYIQQDATLHRLFISGNCSTCFGWYFHPSSGAHTSVSTVPGICHTVTATCRYRGRVGTGLSFRLLMMAVCRPKDIEIHINME
jgi:hypothetical protein